MNKTNKFSILKVAAFTFLFLIILLGTCFLMLSIFLPRVIADFSYDLGLKKFSLYYYERTYMLNKSDDDLFNALSVAIIVEKHEKVVEYFEMFYECENFNKIISETEEKTNNSNLSIVAKSALINEKNYLINNYVNSLIKTNDIEKAVLFAYENFDYENLELSNLGTYSYAFIFTNDNISKQIVTSTINVTLYDDVTLKEELYNYYNLLIQIFNTNYDNLNELTGLQKSQMLYLGRRINVVANNLLVIGNNFEPVIENEEVSQLAFGVTEKLSNLIND